MALFNPAFVQQCVHETKTCTIAQGGTVSTAVDIRGYTNGMFYLTSEFNGDTISFQASDTPDGTFGVTENAGTADSFTAATGTWNAIPSHIFGAGAIKFVTGSATAAAATITVSLKAGA